MSARRWRIGGRVQGVGFRIFALRAARAAEVSGGTGGVRNEADGSVIVVAAGDDAALDRLGAELARGPRHASVTQVESSELVELPAGERFDLEF